MTLADQAAITGHDGQVSSGKPGRPKRRTFTMAYKARIVAAFDELPEGSPGRGELLRRAQAQTLAAPRHRYGIAVRLLVQFINAVYGQAGSFAKYQVLELVARVPYQTWERVAYLAIN